MKTEIKYDFISSPKVIRHTISPQAADILATLIYKQKYWAKEGKLISRKGLNCFHISVADISAETCYKKGVIAKNLNLLKKEDLIVVFRQGLNKPNLYHVDESKVLSFIKKNKKKYSDWRLTLKSKKTTVVPMSTLRHLGPAVAMKVEIEHSGSDQMMVLDNPISSTTKNKNTKNKSTKNLTNCTSAEEDYMIDSLWDKEEEFTNLLEDYIIDSLWDKEEELTNLIEDYMSSFDDESEKENLDELCSFLKAIVPAFKNFNLSNRDIEYIEELSNYESRCYVTAEKIIRNAQNMIEGKKEVRFGNLFVGLAIINEKMIDKYG